MEKIKIRKKITFVAFVFGLLLVNIIVINKTNQSGESLSLKSLILQQAYASEDTCQPECSPGFTCVSGVCVQEEQAVRVSCTVWCWSKLQNVGGHKMTCPATPGGITNCSATACEPDPGACDD